VIECSGTLIGSAETVIECVGTMIGSRRNQRSNVAGTLIVSRRNMHLSTDRGFVPRRRGKGPMRLSLIDE